MKFNLISNFADAKPEEKPWKEFYEENIDLSDVENVCKNMIKYFNEGRREWERPRLYLGFEIVGDSENLELHQWEKTSNTELFRGRVCDLMRCKKCGITGKRYNLSSMVKIDSKYKKKVYQKCNTAILEFAGF